MNFLRFKKKIFKFLLGIVCFVPHMGSGDTLSYRASALVGGYYNHIEINDRFVFATTLRGLEIFTKKGLTVGSWGSPGDAQAVVVAGGYAYLADGNEGLWILDISDPSKPVPVGHYDTGGHANDVAVIKGRVALIADGTKGVRIVDISQPTRPREVGAWVMVNDARSVAVKGNYAYVSDLFFGLHILDISQPIEPKEVGSYHSPGSALAIAVEGDYAFLADGPKGLRIVDISNPIQPFEVGSYESGSGSTQGVIVDGGRAYLAEGDGGLRVVEVTEPSGPKEVGAATTHGPALGVSCSDDFCYVAAGDAGIRVFDISQFPLQEVDTLGRTANVMDVDGAGEYWAVASGKEGVRVLNLTQPQQPMVVGVFSDSPDARVVKMRGPIVYIGDFNTGVKVLDVKNPSNPQLSYTYNALDGIFDLTLSREFIITAVGKSQKGLHVLTKCPTCPSSRLNQKGYYKTSGAAWSVVADSQFVYVADNDSGVIIIDWQNLPAMKKISRISDVKAISALARKGDYLLAAEPAVGLKIYDITKPDQWKRIGELTISGPMNYIAIDGDRAFIAAGKKGIVVVDLSNINQPKIIGSYDTPGEALRVKVSNGLVVVADRYSLEILSYKQ